MIWYRACVFHQRDDVDRPARHDDHGGGHACAAGIRRKSSSGAPVYAILFQLAVANLFAVHPQFRGRTRFIQFALLFCSFFTVLGVIKAAHHAARAAAALSRLGIPGNACGFPARDCLHDVLSVDGTAAAVIAGHFDDDLRPFDLRHLPQAGPIRVQRSAPASPE